MSIVVHKYKLNMAGITELQMPEGAEILSVSSQYDGIVLWAEHTVFETPLMENRKFFCASTGHVYDFSKYDDYWFVGTVQMGAVSGYFVAHVYEVVELSS